MFKFALIATASAIHLNKLDKPINSERQEDFNTETHDINYYRPNKYFLQTQGNVTYSGDYGKAEGVEQHAVTTGKWEEREKIRISAIKGQEKRNDAKNYGLPGAKDALENANVQI